MYWGNKHQELLVVLTVYFSLRCAAPDSMVRGSSEEVIKLKPSYYTHLNSNILLTCTNIASFISPFIHLRTLSSESHTTQVRFQFRKIFRKQSNRDHALRRSEMGPEIRIQSRTQYFYSKLLGSRMDHVKVISSHNRPPSGRVLLHIVAIGLVVISSL
jgi:hypothetical protein